MANHIERAHFCLLMRVLKMVVVKVPANVHYKLPSATNHATVEHLQVFVLPQPIVYGRFLVP
jgi:hypothetical protein